MAKWSSETTVHFVTQYLSHQCLWNPESALYKSKPAKLDAYNRIKEAMKIPGFGVIQIKTKVRNIRSTYSQELRKMKEAAKGEGAAYVPSVRWFPLLHNALRRLRVTVVVTESDHHPPHHALISEDASEAAEEYLPAVTKRDPFEDEHLAETTSSLEAEQSPSEESAPEPRGLSWPPRRHEPHERHAPLSAPGSEHEFDIFGRSVSAQLKALPLRRALRAQQRIQNYITELRLRTSPVSSPQHLSADALDADYM